MANWDGFAPAQPVGVSLLDWAEDRSGGWSNANGDDLRWWEAGPNSGITFTPSGCFGAKCEPMQSCGDPACTNCNNICDLTSGTVTVAGGAPAAGDEATATGDNVNGFAVTLAYPTDPAWVAAVGACLETDVGYTRLDLELTSGGVVTLVLPNDAVANVDYTTDPNVVTFDYDHGGACYLLSSCDSGTANTAVAANLAVLDALVLVGAADPLTTTIPQVDCGTFTGTVLDPDCCDTVPNKVTFQPFWVKMCWEACVIGNEDPNAVYQRMLTELELNGWRQVARQVHLELQNVATDVTGANPSSPAEGIGTLLRNRGVLGLSGGVLVVPMIALPVLEEHGLVTYDNRGRPQGPGQIPVVVDMGFPVTGPAGFVPAAGSAYIYITGNAPTVAFRNEADPGGESWDFQNTRDRRLFYREDRNDCFIPHVRRRGIAVINPCASFAIAIDVRDCSCTDPLPAPTAP